MFVSNWNSTTKIQKISEITNFFRHYFLSRTEVFYNHKLGGKQDSDTKRKALNAVKFKLVLRMFAIGKQNREWEPLDSKSSNEKLAIS